jgi:hypothetical protein
MAALIDAVKDNDETWNALIEAMQVKGDRDTTPLHALAWNNPAVMKDLIAAAKDDEEKWKALMAAMQVGDEDGNTPLSSLKENIGNNLNGIQVLLDFLNGNIGNQRIADLRTKLELK